jgi:hypothetical protein
MIPVEPRQNAFGRKLMHFTGLAATPLLGFSSWLASIFCQNWLLAGKSWDHLKTGKALGGELFAGQQPLDSQGFAGYDERRTRYAARANARRAVLNREPKRPVVNHDGTGAKPV